MKLHLTRFLSIVVLVSILLSALGCSSRPSSAPPESAPPASAEDQSAAPDQPAEPSTGAEAQPETIVLPAPTPTPEPLPDELLTISGQVILPPEVGLSLDGLSLLTNQGAVPVDSSGAFSAQLARNPALPSLVLLMNQQGNPVLLASRRAEAASQPWEVSPDSTARALVLFDPGVWALNPEQQTALESTLPEHSYFQYLGETVAATLLADPVEPLNGELHPDMFKIAALITGELVAEQAKAQVDGKQPAGKALFSPSFRPLAKSNDFVWVEDDITHSLPDVTLVNNTFCYYTASIYLSPEGGGDGAAWNNTAADPLVLDKSKLYSVRISPTSESAMGTERLISPGDGNLRFVFKLDEKRTVWDLGWSIIGAVIGGMGSKVNPQDKAVFGALKESIEAVYGDLLLLISAGKGKGSSELAGEVVGWFGKNSIKVVQAYAEGMSAEWKEKVSSEYLKNTAKILGDKLISDIAKAYTLADVGSTVYSLANSPREITEQGLQRQGFYPAFQISTLPQVIRLPILSNAHTFLPGQPGAAEAADLFTETLVVIVEDLPEDLTTFQLLIDYQDGTPPKVIPASAVDGRASVEDAHTFLNIPPSVKVELLDYLTSRPLGGITVPVLVGDAAATQVFSLRFEYDPGACVNWMCESGWTGCSRVNTNIPVRILEDKVVINYVWENFEKHLTISGVGSLKDGFLRLSLYADYALDKTCVDAKNDFVFFPCQLKENASVFVSGPFDLTLPYEQELSASGSSEVDWPLTEPPPSKDNSLKCSASVIKASLYPGFTEYGR